MTPYTLLARLVCTRDIEVEDLGRLCEREERMASAEGDTIDGAEDVEEEIGVAA